MLNFIFLIAYFWWAPIKKIRIKYSARQLSLAAALSPVVQPVSKHRQYHQPLLRYFSLLLPNCCETLLICVLDTLLSHTFILCFQQLVLTHLQSVFSASCSYTPSVCVLGTVYWYMFYMCYQQPLFRNFQCVFSVTWLTAVGIRCADHVTPLYPQKLALTSPTGGGRSVGIVRSRTKATESEFSEVLKYVLSAASSYTLPICSKHRIAGYIVLWQWLYFYISAQYDARLVKIALDSDVWNASVLT